MPVNAGSHTAACEVAWAGRRDEQDDETMESWLACFVVEGCATPINLAGSWGAVGGGSAMRALSRLLARERVSGAVRQRLCHHAVNCLRARCRGVRQRDWGRSGQVFVVVVVAAAASAAAAAVAIVNCWPALGLWIVRRRSSRRAAHGRGDSGMRGGDRRIGWPR